MKLLFFQRGQTNKRVQMCWCYFLNFVWTKQKLCQTNTESNIRTADCVTVLMWLVLCTTLENILENKFYCSWNRSAKPLCGNSTWSAATLQSPRCRQLFMPHQFFPTGWGTTERRRKTEESGAKEKWPSTRVQTTSEMSTLIFSHVKKLRKVRNYDQSVLWTTVY